MNFIRRRNSLLTRSEILDFILESALAEPHHETGGQICSTELKRNEDELSASTLDECDRNSRELDIPPEDYAVARGVLAQQAAIQQAVKLVEQQLGRPLSSLEKEKILKNSRKILPLPDPNSNPQERIRGPRLSRDLWGH